MKKTTIKQLLLSRGYSINEYETDLRCVLLIESGTNCYSTTVDKSFTEEEMLQEILFIELQLNKGFWLDLVIFKAILDKFEVPC